MVEKTGFWIFLNNPKYWDLEEFLTDNKSENKTLLWSTHRSQKNLFSPDQYGILKIGTDTRTKKNLRGKNRIESGVYAIVKIKSHAKNMDDLKKEGDESIWYNKYLLDEDATYLNGKYYVELKIVKNLIDFPLLFKDVSEVSEIKNDRYLRSGVRTFTLPLSEKCFNKILKLID